MKRLLSFAMVLVFIGCKAEPKPSPEKTPLKELSTQEVRAKDHPLAFEVEVDTSAIKSWSDYDNAKISAWRRYDERKINAWREFDEVKIKMWREYDEFKTAELMKVRAVNYQDYLHWLDAEKMRDFGRQAELERTVFGLARFKAVAEAKYAVYQKSEEEAEKRYKETLESVEEVYKREIQIAEKAYQALVKK